MPHLLVRDRVQPDRGAENDQPARAVHADLAASQPDGLHYATFKLPDGVTFIHVAQHNEPNPLFTSVAFQRFQEGIKDRCDEPATVTELEEVGSYRLFGADL